MTNTKLATKLEGRTISVNGTDIPAAVWNLGVMEMNLDLWIRTGLKPTRNFPAVLKTARKMMVGFIEDNDLQDVLPDASKCNKHELLEIYKDVCNRLRNSGPDGRE
tara:strand:- start:72 stop:389 length:318 start_codon:yes stop_codon:yes gene_type:complete